MRTQSKISLIIIVLLILAGIAIAPWIDGMLFKSNYYHFVQALETDKRVKISILEYREGWMSSDAKISIMPTVDLMSGLPISPNTPTTGAYITPTIILDQHISHGPLVNDPITHQYTLGLASIESNMHLPATVEAVLLGNQANQNGVISIYGLATLGGDYLNQIKTPIFNINIPSLGSIVWQGLSGYINFHMEGKHIQNIKSDITIGAVNARSIAGIFVTENADVKSDMTLDKTGLWNGSYAFTAPKISVTDESDVYSVKNVSFSTQFGVTSTNLYATQLHILLDQLNSPHFSINQQSHINLSIENLNADALLTFINEARQNTSATSEDTQRFESLLPPIISTTTLIKHDSAINTSWGRLIESSQASWPIAVKTVDDIWKNVSAKADIRISVSLVNQLIDLSVPPAPPVAKPVTDTNSTVPSQNVEQPVAKPTSPADVMKQHVADLIKQGYIIVDKDDYVTSITFLQGKLKANGLDVKGIH